MSKYTTKKKNKELKKQERKQIITMKVKIVAPSNVVAILKETTQYYTESFNRICDFAYNNKAITDKNILHKLIYYPEREISPLMSQLVCSSIAKAMEAIDSTRTAQQNHINKINYLNEKNKDKKGYKQQTPKVFATPHSEQSAIRYDARSCVINLLTQTAKLTTHSKLGQAKVDLIIPSIYNKYLGWKLGSSDLCFAKDGTPYLHITITPSEQYKTQREQNIKNNTSPKVVGVDLGINVPVVTSTGTFIERDNFKEIIRRHTSLRSRLQSKGTPSANRHLRRVSERERRFRKDCDHVNSKKLVSLMNPGDTVVLEDLTNIRDKKTQDKDLNRDKNTWSFNQLQTFIVYKCFMKGVKAVYVDPSYTSQTCNKCGYIDKNNRRTQSEFACLACGHTSNADVNAAQNIRDRYVQN